jgi:hypothetical protein
LPKRESEEKVSRLFVREVRPSGSNKKLEVGLKSRWSIGRVHFPYAFELENGPRDQADFQSLLGNGLFANGITAD